MLVGLCGSICAGKQSVARYLIEHYGFSELRLSRPTEIVHIDNYSSETDSNTQMIQLRQSTLTFPSADALLEYATPRWQMHWLTSDIWDKGVLETFSQRPFFLLLSVDAPVSLRWQRFRARRLSSSLAPLALTDFLVRNDEYLFSQPFGLSDLMNRADLRLINHTSSLQKLHESLDKLDLLNEQLLRPSWDQYFMQLASLAAQRSNCMKRRVGCVLVRDKRVISTGYNGTPRNLRNCNEGGCPRCNDGQSRGVNLSTCLCIHAEENALIEAGRERISREAVLYCDTCPCLTCSIKITQVGIAEVVYTRGYSMDQEYFKKGA